MRAALATLLALVCLAAVLVLVRASSGGVAEHVPRADAERVALGASVAETAGTDGASLVADAAHPALREGLPAPDPARHDAKDRGSLVHGVVRDAAGVPLEGAEVVCDVPDRATRTDAAGCYELRRGEAPRERAVRMFARHATEGIARFEGVVPGDGVVDFRLDGGARFLVSVVGPGGLAVADARVSLWQSDETSSPGVFLGTGRVLELFERHALLGSRRVAVGYTGERGIADLRGLEIGRYRLEVRCAPFVPYQEEGVSVPSRTLVDHGTIALVEGLSLRGTATTCAGEAVSGALVRALFEYRYYETRSGPDGSFAVEGIEPTAIAGEVLVADAASDAFWHDTKVRVDPDRAPLEARLCPSSLTVLVRTEQGPYDGPATVELREAADGGALRPGSGEPRRTATVSRGELVLQDVSSAIEALVVRIPGHYGAWLDVTSEARARPIELTMEPSGGLILAGLPDAGPAMRFFLQTELADEFTLTSIPGVLAPEGYGIDAQHFLVSASARLCLPSPDEERRPGKEIYAKASGDRLPTSAVRLVLVR